VVGQVLADAGLELTAGVGRSVAVRRVDARPLPQRRTRRVRVLVVRVAHALVIPVRLLLDRHQQPLLLARLLLLLFLPGTGVRGRGRVRPAPETGRKKSGACRLSTLYGVIIPAGHHSPTCRSSAR